MSDQAHDGYLAARFEEAYKSHDSEADCVGGPLDGKSFPIYPPVRAFLFRPELPRHKNQGTPNGCYFLRPQYIWVPWEPSPDA